MRRGQAPGQSHLIARVGVSFAGIPNPSPPSSASPPRRFSATSLPSPDSAPSGGASTCSPPSARPPDRAPVLPERRAQSPVKTVLNSPMLPHGAQNPVRPSRQAGYEVPPVNRSLAVHPPSGLYHRHAAHVRPLAPVVHVSDDRRSGRRPASAALDAPMPLVHSLETVMFDSREPRSLAVFEGFDYVFPQPRLIFLDSQNIVSPRPV